MPLSLSNWKQVGCPAVGALQYLRVGSQDFVLAIPSNTARLFAVDYNGDGSPNFQEIPVPDANFVGNTFANPVGVGQLILGTRASDTGGYAALNGFQVNGDGVSPVSLTLNSASAAAFNTSSSLLVVSDEYLFVWPLIATTVNPALGLSGGVVLPIKDILSATQPGHYLNISTRPVPYRGQPLGKDVGPLPVNDSLTVAKNVTGYMVHLNGRLYYWGGTVLTWGGASNTTTMADTKVWSADIRRFRPGDALNWVETGVVPAALQRGRTTTWRDWIISIGGYTTTTVGTAPDSAAIIAAKIGDTQTFTQVALAPNTMNRGAIWTRNDRLYIIGGNNGASGTALVEGWVVNLEETR